MSISVVIPTYNRRERVSRAIRSVLGQTLASSEIIVVDDGSTDGTSDDLENEFAGQIQLIRLEENQGVSAARNRAIASATGEWIAFLDSDDEWLPEKLEKQAPLFEKYRWVHGEEVWLRNHKPLKQLARHQKTAGNLFFRSLELCLVSPSTAVLHRSLFEQYGGFDESLPVCEDYDLWLRLFAHEDIGFCEDPVIIKHGGHEDQLSRRFFAMDYWRIQSMMKLLDDESLDPSKRVAVQRQILRKSDILLRGYQKHRNFENWRAIFLQRQNSLREIGPQWTAGQY